MDRVSKIDLRVVVLLGQDSHEMRFVRDSIHVYHNSAKCELDGIKTRQEYVTCSLAFPTQTLDFRETELVNLGLSQ